MSELAGRNCIVTGASRGLGARVAAALWEAGASLLLVARSAPGLQEVAGRLPPRPGQRVAVLRRDLADPAASEGIISEAEAALGGLDVLVNNAAIQGPIGRTWETDLASWEQTIAVNLLAAVRLCRCVVPSMARRGGGKIISVSGGGAATPRANFAAYAASKAGLVRFCETLAEETRGLRIDINCIAPGAMGTAMSEAIVEAGAAAAGQREIELAMQARSAGEKALDRAAALCVFLASGSSDGISGRLISAVWDPWAHLGAHVDELQQSDVYTLRRIVPRERGFHWD
jgi:NAD(P)-dependent dehydrogenase (short-subunit alcohol dehydrogenase family)